MQVSQLTINNFRGIRKAALQFSGHTLLIGGNNVGKSTICEALDLVILTDLTTDIKTMCAANLEFWHKTDKRLLAEGEIAEGHGLLDQWRDLRRDGAQERLAGRMTELVIVSRHRPDGLSEVEVALLGEAQLTVPAAIE